MQHDFAAEVVADLDLFLVLVGGVVYRIVTLRFKEKMANLAAGHRHRPSDQGRDRGVPEQQEPHENEADRAQKMKRFVNQAMVIIAVIVPTLNFQRLHKATHLDIPLLTTTGSQPRSGQSAVLMLPPVVRISQT